jgi:hypothetical protein
MTKSWMIAVLLLCLISAAMPAYSQAAYHVTLLGLQNSFGMSGVADLNKWGQVVGVDSNVFNPSALLWTPTVANGTTGTTYVLSTATGFPTGTASSYPSGLNDRGQVTGTAYTPGHGDGNQTQSWMWRPSPLNSSTGVLNGGVGKAITFDQVSIPGLGSSAEYNDHINNSGTIVASGIYYHTLLWNPTVKNGLGGTWTYEPNYCAPPAGINDAGQIAGGTCESGSENAPYRHTGALPLLDTDLITSPLWLQPPTPVYIGNASGINQHGDLAISATSIVQFIRAYLYKNGAATDISGGQDSRGIGINDFDQVVGSVSATSTATLFENGKVIDLNPLFEPPIPPVAYVLKSAVRINNAGQIICSGLYFDGGEYGTGAAFLLTPIVANVSKQVAVSRGKITRVGSTYSQTITLTNNGANITGPVSLVLDVLTSGVTLTNATGSTAYAPPVGSPYIDFSTGDFAPGAVDKVKLTFSDPANVQIKYTTRILGGNALR